MTKAYGATNLGAPGLDSETWVFGKPLTPPSPITALHPDSRPYPRRSKLVAMVSGVRQAFLVTALFAFASHAIATAATPAPAGPQPSLPFAIGDARAIILYFIATDCPISNRLLPEMLRIEHEFATQRVRFFFVYPNASDTPATIAAHRAAYGPTTKERILTDPHQTLARLAGANTTPEAAVLIPEGTTLKPVYTGRIDDRFISLGTERPTAFRHDLEEALSAVFANRPVLPPGGPPVGCAFMTLATK